MGHYIYLNDHLYNIFDITSVNLNRKALRIEVGIRNSKGIYKEAVSYEDSYDHFKEFEDNLIYKEWQVLLEKLYTKEKEGKEDEEDEENNIL